MKITVVQKTIAGFTVLLLLMLTQALVSFINQKDMLSQQAFQLETLSPITHNINLVSTQLLQANKITMQHLSTKEEAQRQALETNFNDIKLAFEQSKTQLQNQLLAFPTLKAELENALPPSQNTFDLAISLQKQNNLKSQQSAELLQALNLFKEEWEFFKTDIEELTLDLSQDDALSDRFSFQFMNQIANEFINDVNITLAIRDSFEYERVLALQQDRYQAMLNTVKELGDYQTLILDRMQFYIDYMAFTLNQAEGVYAKLQPVIIQKDRTVNLQQSLNLAVNQADLYFSNLNQALEALAKTTYESSIKDNQEHSLIQGGFLILSLSAALFIGYSTVRSIKRPLSIIMHNLAKMAQGDLSQELSMKTQDEFGMIANQVNSLRHKLIDIIQQLANVSEQVSSVSQHTCSSNQETDQQITYQYQETSDMKHSIEQLHNAANQVSDHAKTSSVEVTNLYKLAQQAAKVLIITRPQRIR